MASICPIEDDECIEFHKFLDELGFPHEHIPNESRSSKRDAYVRGRKLKNMGVSKGYWDYDVYVPYTRYGKIAYKLIKIEMKRAKKSLSKVSDEQKVWGDIYNRARIDCKICYGAEEAKDFVLVCYRDLNDRC